MRKESQTGILHEHGLEDANSLLAAIVESSDDAIISKDLLGTVTSWNKAAERMFGYGAGEMLGESIERLIPQEHRDEEVEIYGRLGRGEEIHQWETTALRKDGSRIPVSLTISPIRDAAGGIIGASDIIRDISERLEREEAFDESRAIVEKTFATETIGVLFFSLDGQIGNANGAFQRMSGYTREELIRLKHWKLLTPQEFWEATERTAASLAASGAAVPYEKQMLRKDGSRWWGLFAPTRLNGKGAASQCMEIIIDISKRKEAEEGVRKHAGDLEGLVAERTARLAETVAELESFSYTIAHDMRAPLRAMQSFATILLDRYAPALDERGREFLRRIGASATRLDHLIQDVLRYSRMVRSELPLEPVDTHGLMHEIIQTYPNLTAHAEGIQVVNTLPWVLGNRAALTQVFANLLGNAVKFVAPGVRPEIEVSSGQPLSLQSSRGSGAGFVRLSFQDNGIGIEASAHKTIFQMFHRAASGYDGTGIGLAVVRKAVERMGGRVGVESEAGKGSCFWVELRRA